MLRFLRYAVGSAAASLVSAVTLAVAYQGIGLDPRISSIVAFCAGALVNFLIYRFWAWRTTAESGAANRKTRREDAGSKTCRGERTRSIPRSMGRTCSIRSSAKAVGCIRTPASFPPA